MEATIQGLGLHPGLLLITGNQMKSEIESTFIGIVQGQRHDGEPTES